MENKNLVRVVFYVIDDFENPHRLIKSSIGYMTKEIYEQSKMGNGPTCFDVGNDYYAENFPDIITK